MADQELRRLEQQAVQGDAEAAARLLRKRAERGLLDGPRYGPFQVIEERPDPLHPGETVHAAWDRERGAEVRLVVWTGLPTPSSIRDRLERHVAAARRLDHPRIPRPSLHLDIEQRVVALGEDWHDGQSLTDDAVWTAHPRAARVGWVRDAADALAVAHAAGVTHGALGGHTLLLTESGVQVCGWIPLHLDPGIPRLTGCGGQDIHPELSPNQLMGRSPYDPRCDVWSLGVLLHRALTGNQPFEGESMLERANAILRDPIPRPRQVDPEIPPALEQVCLACLRRDPREDRYPDAAAVRDDLDRALAGEPVQPPPLTRRTTRVWERVRGWFGR